MQACGTTEARAGEKKRTERKLGERCWKKRRGRVRFNSQVGGQGDHGAAKPDGVIHTYSDSYIYGGWHPFKMDLTLPLLRMRQPMGTAS